MRDAARNARRGERRGGAGTAPAGGFVVSPERFDGVLFDLDGVVTATATVHARAWKLLFDDYLKRRAEREGQPFRPFGDEDYRLYVDGKPRYAGVESFLSSRGISLPHGEPGDRSDADTVTGLGNRKDEIFGELLRKHGVESYPDALRLIGELRRNGIKIGVVSSSKNCAAVLAAAGIARLFDVRFDGVDTARLGLKGKPDPDVYLRAAERLGVRPARAAVVEDALSGIEAARSGGFGLVIGVDRTGHGAALKEAGADVVVTDLGEIAVARHP